MRWNAARRAWSVPTIIEENFGTSPDDALPLDRWDDWRGRAVARDDLS